MVSFAFQGSGFGAENASGQVDDEVDAMASENLKRFF